jgi:hypothetical protein
MQKQGKKLLCFFGAIVLLFLPMIVILTGCSPLSADDVVNSLLPNL